MCRRSRVYIPGIVASIWLIGVVYLSLVQTVKVFAIPVEGVNIGYFSGNSVPSFSPVLKCIDSGGNLQLPIDASMANKATFIAAMREYLNTARTGACPGITAPSDIKRNKTGAAFIIQTMRGVVSGPGSRPVRPTVGSADEIDWENRINQSNVSISWENYTFSTNSGYSGSTIDDDAFYNDVATVTPALVFRQNGVIVYVLKGSCANPVDNFKGITITLDTPPTVSVDTLNCTANVLSGVALDGDWGGEIQVQIWVGGPPGVGAGYTVNTSGHRYTFNDPNSDTMVRSGQVYYVRALGVNSSGVYNGVLIDAPPASMGPCNSAACVLPSNFPGTMTVGQTYYLKPQIRLAYPWGPPYRTGAAGADYDPTMHVTVVNETSGAVVYDQDVRYDSGFPAPGVTLTANPTGLSGDVGIPFTPNSAGRYGLAWSLRGALTVNCNGGGAGDGHQEHGDAGFSPFFTVTGGDILADGDIRSWNDDGSGGSYAGGGVQLAALATGSIQNFITGSGMAGGAAANSGHGLGFANTGASGTTYGSGYDVTAFVPEVPAQTATLWGTVDLSSLTDGAYYAGGDITLYGELPTASQVTIVVAAGNSVYVSGNITYGAYGANPADIPRLTVIVQDGNISVDRTVNEIHGIFTAQGTGANGNFQTCASAVNTPITSATPNAYALCNSRLIVYGAVAANKLVLGRTYGTYRANAAGVPILPAEEFYYSPELWLAPDGTDSASRTQNRYDSFVSLPPVL